MLRTLVRWQQNAISQTALKQRQGTILVMAAVFMIVLIAMSAFAIDLSYVALSRTQLQSTADAAAMAGVIALTNGPGPTRAAVKANGAKNLAAGYSLQIQDPDIVLGTWDNTSATFTALSGAAESNANAVQVTCYLTSARKTSINLFFSPVLGQNTANLTSTAIATINTSRCGLIVGIPSVTMSSTSYTDSYDASQGSYISTQAGQQGHVCTNGDITMSGAATINGDAHPGIGKTVKTSGTAKVVGQTKALKKALSYAAVNPGNAATVNNNSNIGLSALGKNPVDSSGNFTLSGTDSITLKPGTYYFAKFSLSGGSSITITGATIIYATGNVDLSGGTVANTTMLPKNLQLFPMGQTCNISGSSALYAVVYGPSTAITRSGMSDYYGAIVGAALTLSGSGGIHADTSLNYSYLGGSTSACKLVQ